MKPFLLFLQCIILVACNPEGSRAPIQATPVSIISAEAVSGYNSERVFVGEVQARRAGVVGFELPGVLDELNLEVADLVDEGEVIARLDSARLTARRDEAQAMVNEVRTRLGLAKSTYERIAAARLLDAVSAQAEDEARQAVEESEARLATAEASLALVEVDLEKSILRAPYSAMVEEKHADLGGTLAPGQPVVSLTATDESEIRFTFSAKDLSIGQKVPFTTGTINSQGILTRLRETRDSTTRAMEGFIEPDAATAANLRPGVMVSIRLPSTITTDGFWLPRSALTEGTRGLWACYVVDADNRLERIDLEWLHAEDDRVFVRGTLKDGDSVVSQGIHRLMPGLAVNIVPEAP
jgi:RND family efflux transporter MFP subunit